MNKILELCLKRAGRFIVSYGVGYLLWLLATTLSGLPVPAILTPVIAAIVNAIGKYIRETLKLRVPF